MRADWTASGACTSGSTAHPRGATRRACGGAATTSTNNKRKTMKILMVPLIHLGMIIVGVPYSTQGMIHTEARGGTPYGATTIAGPRGELQPTQEDLAIAKVLGQRVATITKKLRG